MTSGSDGSADVTVRYWASARAAAGTEQERVPAGTLAAVLDELRRRHRGNEAFGPVLSVCAVLVGDRPVGRTDPASIQVSPGGVVELLPPFAGG